MFDDRLRKLRLKSGKSQQEVANDLNLKVNTYRNYENDEREPEATTFMKIAAYFGVALDELFDYHPENYFPQSDHSEKEKSPSLTYTEREAYEKILSELTDEELIELKKFTSFLKWKRTHKQD